MFRQLILFLALLSFALAAKPTSFCKCTCFTNSTIIPLTSPSSVQSNLFLRADEPSNTNTTVPHGRTCADCNKQFCLNYNLPICTGATEEDVFTSCFQRDSFKDQVIVCVFIIGTVGLLVWAAIRPVVQRWREGRGGYVGVGGE